MRLSARLRDRPVRVKSGGLARSALRQHPQSEYGQEGRSEAVQMTALVFVAGLYVLAAVEDMLEEAHESAEDNKWSAFSFLGGFALFLLVSAGMG